MQVLTAQKQPQTVCKQVSAALPVSGTFGFRRMFTKVSESVTFLRLLKSVKTTRPEQPRACFCELGLWWTPWPIPDGSSRCVPVSRVGFIKVNERSLWQGADKARSRPRGSASPPAGLSGLSSGCVGGKWCWEMGVTHPLTYVHESRSSEV